MKVLLQKISRDGIVPSLKTSGVFRFFLCNLLFSINFWLVFAYYPIYFNKLGISDKRIGVLVAVLSFVTLISVFPFGVASDRFSAKTLLRTGAFTLAVGNVLITQSNNFYYVLLIVMLSGAGSTLFIVTLFSLYYKQLEGHRRGVKIALFTLGTSLGFGIGPFAGGFIIKYIGLEWVFMFSAFFNFVLFFLVSYLRSSVPVKFRIDMYWKDLVRPDVLFLIIVVFIMSSHFGVERTCMTLLMSKVINLSGLQTGTIFLAIGLWISVLGLFAGHFFDKTKRVILLIAFSMLITGVFQIVTAYVDSFASLLIVRLLHTIGDSSFMVLKGVLITIIFPLERMGGNFGFVYSINTLASSIFALISGILSGYYGYGFPFIASGLLLVVVAVILIITKGRVGRILMEHKVR